MKLCSAVVTKTEELCPSFLSQAREISVKFEQVFKVFDACHFVYDSADYLADGKIDKLGKSKKKKTFMENMNTIIRSCLKSVPPFLVFLLQRKTSQIFLGFFREKFPGMTIKPKLRPYARRTCLPFSSTMVHGPWILW